MTIVYNNPFVIGSGICKDVVTPLCLDKRLPKDTLFMVLEEDFRFFPEGQDPDGCDDYEKRVLKMIDRGFAAQQGSESPPPQKIGPSPSRGKSSGKGGQAKAGEPLPLNLFERLFQLKGRGKRGLQQQLGRLGEVGHCGPQA